jgi:hypothetical protein
MIDHCMYIQKKRKINGCYEKTGHNNTRNSHTTLIQFLLTYTSKQISVADPVPYIFYGFPNVIYRPICSYSVVTYFDPKSLNFMYSMHWFNKNFSFYKVKIFYLKNFRILFLNCGKNSISGIKLGFDRIQIQNTANETPRK